MKYVKVAQTAEFIQARKKKISIEGRQILLAYVDDAYYAVDNTCTHMGGSLYDGKLDGDHIVCPRHGSEFDLRTGKLARSGKMAFIKVKAGDIRTYPVKIEGDDILVGI
ncbi:MAG: Rieske 2Fe-2S domain-containing protein [Eubacteriales bacterium]|nr:Rieske 2Fe-2S domain-containing protein [Eubacteriales bacterium]